MLKMKCVIVGDGTVGKTAMMIRYTSNSFHSLYIPTVFDNIAINHLYKENTIEIMLWDTAGQEDYDRIRPLSYPNTDVFILCFSINNFNSFENVKFKWIRELNHFGNGVPIILVGTKSDLRNESIKTVTTAQGEELAKNIKAKAYLECSSLTGAGVKEVIDKVTEIFFTKTMNPPQSKKKRCHIL